MINFSAVTVVLSESGHQGLVIDDKATVTFKSLHFYILDFIEMKLSSLKKLLKRKNCLVLPLKNY
jgi:hypothetical protein